MSKGHAHLDILTETDLDTRERAWTKSRRAQLAHWATQLADGLPVLELPSDHSRKAGGAFENAQYTFQIPKANYETMRRHCKKTGTDPYTFLLTTLKVLVLRYTDQTEIVVAAPARSLFIEEQDEGFSYWEMLTVLRSNLAGNPTFDLAVSQVKQTIDSVKNRGGIPFSLLKKMYSPDDNLTCPTFSQIVFDFCPQGNGALSLPRKDLSLGTSKDAPIQFDLCLSLMPTSLTEAENSLIGTIIYNAAILQEETVIRLATHFLTLLATAATNPGTPIGYLPLLTEAEQQQMLVAWNQTSLPLGPFACIHTLFEAQVKHTPNATALIFEEQRLSYAEIDRRANQLAHHLQALRVKPGVLVGVCLERSTEMIVGMLAILKAGGAYVPLDPAYPQERIAFMLQDTAAPIVLTQQRLCSQLESYDTQLLCLDTDWSTIAQSSDSTPASTILPDNLAYVIYTSGSTGRPKGVMISHHNAVAMLIWAARTFPPEDLQGTLAVTSICFDLSVYEIFLPLSQGKTIILARNALHLLTLPARDQVTLINTVPSAIKELVQADGIPHSVRTVNLAGEPLKRVLVQQVYAQANVQRVYNLYGPSEDTTYSTFVMVERDELHEPTIGRPIGNTQAYILDRWMQPVPVGVTGELYLGGDGVSRGYLKQPALTARRYVPDPFGQKPGGRLYYTGDVVRYTKEGDIEFLGRSDHQVKIRGFRIELGEIDAILSQHPGIASVVVVAHENTPGEKRLVAYYVAAQETAPTISELRRHIQAHLPDYMVPSVFVRLDVMPLTPTGKINRRVLPEPEKSRPDIEAAYAAPRTPIEETLVAIWEEVLQLEDIGIHDDFFELGGQSLLAAQVTSRLNARLDTSLSFSFLFEHPTISSLGKELQGRQADGLLTSPIQPISHTGPMPLATKQYQVWFLDQLSAKLPTYNIPIHFEITGEIDPTLIERCLDEIVQRHEVLRTVYREIDNDIVQIVEPPRAVPFIVKDLRHLPKINREEKAQQILDQQARQKFDLSQDLLIRGLLLQMDDATSHLLVTVHHIAFDGWSTSVLMQEIGALYRAFSVGQPSPLPELAIQYGDFVEWEKQHWAERVQEEDFEYWRKLFDRGAPILDLPTDRPRPAVQSYRGARLTHHLPQQLLDELETFSRRQNTSLFMTLLAGLGVLFYRHTGQTDFFIGTPFANRNHAEIEGLLGYFLNMLPLRINLEGDPTFSELLARVRQVALGIYAHQDVSGGRATQEIKIDRDPSYNLVFQVMLAVQNIPIKAVELINASRNANAVMRYVQELDTGTSKLDLTLFVEFLDAGPVIFAEYNTDLFDAATISRLLDHYQTLLEDIVVDSTQRVQDMQILTDTERGQLTTAWNTTQKAYPEQTTVHQLVEAQAATMPDNVAAIYSGTGLVGQGQTLTYRELSQRANRLAHHLCDLGVGPDVPVGIYMERSLDMLVGLLGTLKAGGTYIPLDPAHPRERIAFMLADAGAPMLLTQSALRAQLPPHQAQVVCIDTDWDRIARHPETAPTPLACSDNTAYIIYTSGSTGRPKGVQITHRALVNFLTSMRQSPGLASHDTLLAVTTLSFDIAGLELWLPLTTGATAIIADLATAGDGVQLQHLMRQAQPTVMQATPATWRMLLASGWQGNPRLKALCGGEALPPQLARQLAPHVASLWNLYGPTETTIWSTLCPIAPVEGDEPITIGRPIANTEIYILDANLTPTPIGVSGDLYIGGAGLARGYFRRAALTAEKFIPHPFSRTPGARLYATGDLARYHPDGSIEFMGRSDHQVKVRGFRIELGEIESVIEKHPAIRQAAVVVKDPEGDKRIVAYLSTGGGGAAAPNVSALRRFLAERLPNYMLPASFVMLDTFPLTPSGKVDRRALPEPDTARPKVETAFVAPRNDFEEIVSAVWQEVLKCDQIGVFDNFFDLGGHSLMATQVLSRIRDRFEVEMPVSVLLEAPTVAQLSTRVEEIILAEIVALDEAGAPNL
jgi:amino acid adenylation domain-containing protein